VTKDKKLELLDRSYAFTPCDDCREWSMSSPDSDYRCPGCGTSPKERVRAQEKNDR
jgi:tRNA(Ile2) C34 agmatinyltransferase TiaS